jgi:excisionase family DNA binding protein
MAQLLTKREACALLRVSLPTLNQWHKNGLLPYLKIGKRTVRISADDVRQLLDRSKRT